MTSRSSRRSTSASSWSRASRTTKRRRATASTIRRRKTGLSHTSVAPIAGPLSSEGLREIYTLILQVAKSEAAALSEKEAAEKDKA